MLTIQTADLVLSKNEFYRGYTTTGTVTLMGAFPPGTSLILHSTGMSFEPKVISPTSRTTSFKGTALALGEHIVGLVRDGKTGSPLAARRIRVHMPQIQRLEVDGGTTVTTGATRRLTATLASKALGELEVRLFIANNLAVFDYWRSPSPLNQKKRLTIAKGQTSASVNVAFMPGLTSPQNTAIQAELRGGGGGGGQTLLQVRINP